MAVDFRISKLTVDNFRCVSYAKLEFHDKVSSYLIGANNSGKSTILNSIALALNGGGFHSFSPSEFDYYHDIQGNSSKEFLVSLEFQVSKDEQLPAVQGVGNPSYVGGIRVVGKTESTGRFYHKRYLLDIDGKPITYSPRTPLKGQKKEEFKDYDLGWSQYYATIHDIREHIPEVWLLTAGNLRRSLYEWRTGPLQRLSKLLSEKFLRDKWNLDYDNKKRKMPNTLYKVHEFFQHTIKEFPFWKDDLKPKLEESISNYLGKHAIMELEPKIEEIEQWLTQRLVVSFSGQDTGPLTPLSSMGDGWQSIVRLASLDVLSKFPEICSEDIVLLFEEPETYLHPHLRRKIRSTLDGLAKSGWFVVVSTHAPEMIDFRGNQCITRLSSNKGSTAIASLLMSKVPEAAKFQEKIDEQGNHEMFFARSIVFCEGKDDCYALRLYLEKRDIDLDGRSVSIIGVGGNENIIDYVLIANALNIPWCALTDEDKDIYGEINVKTAELRNQLRALQRECDLLVIWKDSLEVSLGVDEGKKAKPVWQAESIEPLSIKKIMSKFSNYSETCEQIIGWIEK